MSKTPPVLFLVFNRPEQTRQVMERIREQRPTRLYIAADGPRKTKSGESERCEEVRKIVSAVDWPCDLKTLFRSENLGCGRAVSEAITWFFDNEESGIILEDDCLPHRDFFSFCALMLERYRDDPRVATIGGISCLPTELVYSKSHYSSKYFQMWGWASWRRFWQNYDFGLTKHSASEWSRIFQSTHPNKLEVKFWELVYGKLTSGGFDTWDFQVFFSAWKKQCVHIMPGVNLVSNLGYGADATHTTFESTMANRPTFPLVVTDGLVDLTPDRQLDDVIFYIRYLDSLGHSYWLEQMVAPTSALADCRNKLYKLEKRCAQLENEVEAKRRQLRLATSK